MPSTHHIKASPISLQFCHERSKRVFKRQIGRCAITTAMSIRLHAKAQARLCDFSRCVTLWLMRIACIAVKRPRHSRASQPLLNRFSTNGVGITTAATKCIASMLPSSRRPVDRTASATPDCHTSPHRCDIFPEHYYDHPLVCIIMRVTNWPLEVLVHHTQTRDARKRKRVSGLCLSVRWEHNYSFAPMIVQDFFNFIMRISAVYKWNMHVECVSAVFSAAASRW